MQSKHQSHASYCAIGTEIDLQSLNLLLLSQDYATNLNYNFIYVNADHFHAYVFWFGALVFWGSQQRYYHLFDLVQRHAPESSSSRDCILEHWPPLTSETEQTTSTCSEASQSKLPIALVLAQSAAVKAVHKSFKLVMHEMQAVLKEVTRSGEVKCQQEILTKSLFQLYSYKVAMLNITGPAPLALTSTDEEKYETMAKTWQLSDRHERLCKQIDDAIGMLKAASSDVFERQLTILEIAITILIGLELFLIAIQMMVKMKGTLVASSILLAIAIVVLQYFHRKLSSRKSGP